MAELELSGLRFERPGFSLAVDLSLPAGCLGVILGASGCGKSTTLRLIAGFVAPLAGSIRLGGRELTGLPPERRNVGLMFQDLALFPHLSARKNIEYGPRLKGMERHERAVRVGDLADTLRIAGLLDRKPSALSGGEQQRVALARSLAASPELLLLDEPLSSLDAALRRELRTELRGRIRERGLSALHVTHDIEEALSLGDRVYVMDSGRIVQAGSPEEIWTAPANAVVARLLGRGPLLEVRSLETRAGSAIAMTDFGSFAVEGRPPEGRLFLHFPAEALHTGSGGPAAAAAGGGSADTGAAETLNVLSGTVRDCAFTGRGRRILLEARGERLALELSGDFTAREGQRIELFVEPSECRLLA
jgi:putative spermidine/putrescine transport system ATP-binding protein